MGLRNDETEGWGREEMPSAHLPLSPLSGEENKGEERGISVFSLPMGNHDPATSCF